MEDYFYYLPGEKPEKAPAYVDIGDFRIWGVWIKEERLLQYLTDRTIARKKARKKNSQTVYSLLRRLWKRKIGIQKTEDIAGAACVDLKDPMHKVASEALKKRLPGEDLLMWDFPGKLYYAFGRDMLQKLFEGQGQITLFCLLSAETDHELPQFLADQALYLQELVFLRLHTERTGQKTCWRRSMRKRDSWEAAAVMRNCLCIWQTGSSMRIQ